MNIDIDDLLDSKCVTVSTENEHKAIVTIGRDIIEAEYFTFEHSDWQNPKKMNAFEKVWDAITTPFCRVKRWIKDAYWEVRYGFQRMFKGYDDVDTFEIFYKFINRYEKVIAELRNNHYGHPCDLTDEEWNNILDTMLYHLHYMKEDNVVKELEKDVPDNWSASLKTINEIMKSHKDKFFALFSEYFYDLWD